MAAHEFEHRRRWLILSTGLLHVLVWWAIVNRDRSPGDLLCDEGSCWTLGTIDFPASFLFMWGTEETVTIGSFLLGTVWWMLLTFLLTSVGRRLWMIYREFRRRHPTGIES